MKIKAKQVHVLSLENDSKEYKAVLRNVSTLGSGYSVNKGKYGTTVEYWNTVDIFIPSASSDFFDMLKNKKFNEISTMFDEHCLPNLLDEGASATLSLVSVQELFEVAGRTTKLTEIYDLATNAGFSVDELAVEVPGLLDYTSSPPS